MISTSHEIIRKGSAEELIGGRPVETIPKLVELACAELTRRRAERSV
jgi:hypothetical protein